jgi:hypothetical protein
VRPEDIVEDALAEYLEEAAFRKLRQKSGRHSPESR